MMVRFLIPSVAVLLFLLEPEFAMLSPIEIKGEVYFLVPRFLILYLIFISIYYSRQRAVMYGLFLVSCMMCFTLILLDYIQFYIHLYVF